MEKPKPQKLKRPKETNGTTARIDTGCGHLYITLGKDGDTLIEIFATLGKAGACTKAQLEAIARSVSLGLKYGIPIQEYIDEFIGIRCPSPTLVGNPERETLSCADAIAKVLRREIKNNETNSNRS